jgi:signal transduction histidine kinase
VHHRRSRALAEARTRFVANVSHELRTPLAQISMFAETLHLGRERSDAERRQFARIMFAEARRLTALIENVLRFSRSEHGAVTLSCARHPLGEIVANAVRAFAPIAADADVAIDVDMEDVDATVDPVALHQVVLNLLDNAVKHGGRGVRVRVALREHAGMATLTIDDSGPGIPRAQRDHVFRPFAQLAGRNVAGAGIGLAIVRDVVLAHGGRVWVEDAPHGGARVVITIPAHAPTVPVPEARPAPVAR